MKKCSKCEEEKEFSEFYGSKVSKDGLSSWCKKCVKKKVFEYQKTNKSKEYKREYHKEYRKTDKYKEFMNRDDIKKKVSTREKLRYSVRSGKLKRQPCEVCGKLNGEGHHNDYDKPLEVIWLCGEHHKELHYEQNNY